MLVKTVRVVGIISLLVSGGVLVCFAIELLPDESNTKRNPELSIISEYRKRGGNLKYSRNEPNPLIKQAKAFSLHLNPPKPKVKPVPKLIPKQTVRATRVMKSSPKFSLVATSYYQSKPDKSRGLVLEPGSGYRWIKQGEHVGHFVVEKIEPGLITYRNGDKLLEMAVKTDINVIAPDTGRTTIASASSQASTVLFARSNTHKPNRVRRKTIPASVSTKSKARPAVNRQIAVKTQEIVPTSVHRSVSRSRPSGSLKSNKVMRKTTPKSNSARPQTIQQTSYERRKNRV